MPYDTSAALKMLKAGNRRFVQGRSAGHFSMEQRIRSLEGQQPWAVVVGCSDSRVPVEAVFDVGPGELFVVRTAGHVLAQASLASVRFAVQELGAQTVVVLGHEDCGAVAAALAGDSPEWLAPIVQHIRVDSARRMPPEKTVDALLAAAVYEHVAETVEELSSFFKTIEEATTRPQVVGAAYQLASGEVHWLDG